LPHYIGDKTRQQVEDDTVRRDKIIQDWIDGINDSCPGKASYQVITDCHHEEYKQSSLQHFFYSVPELAKLVDHYPDAKKITRDEVVFCHDELTFLAIVQGKVPVTKRKPVPSRPLLMRRQENQKYWDRYSATGETQCILVTRDYLDYLRKEHNFQVTKIFNVLFYRKCDQLGQIYKDLTEERSKTLDESKKQLLKKIQNLSCGFTGYRGKGEPGVRLRSTLPRDFQIGTRDVREAGSVDGVPYLFVETKQRPPSPLRKVSHNALPIFACIVEFGKLRICQILHFFDKYLRVGTHRHLYSNVDNCLLALTTDTLDEAVPEEKKAQYFAEKSNFFTPNLPGHLKEQLKFTADQDWKFVSPMTHNWSVVTNDVNTCSNKNSAFNNVSAQRSYEIGLDYLAKKPVSVEQVRRVDKQHNTNTHIQTFTFQPK